MPEERRRDENTTCRSSPPFPSFRSSLSLLRSHIPHLFVRFVLCVLGKCVHPSHAMMPLNPVLSILTSVPGLSSSPPTSSNPVNMKLSFSPILDNSQATSNDNPSPNKIINMPPRDSKRPTKYNYRCFQAAPPCLVYIQYGPGREAMVIVATCPQLASQHTCAILDIALRCAFTWRYIQDD